MYDEKHSLLQIIGSKSKNSNFGTIHAYPHSVNSCLPENEQLFADAASKGAVVPIDTIIMRDGRVPSNLVDETSSSSWLAPLRSSLDHNDMTPNVIYITFDRPTTLSYVKIFNYTKTPSRGVSGFDIAIDDVHVYSGTLQPGNIKKEQIVLFTDDQKIIQLNSNNINYCGSKEQCVLLINERVVKGGALNHQTKRGVGAYHGDVPLDLSNRPQTAAPPRDKARK